MKHILIRAACAALAFAAGAVADEWHNGSYPHKSKPFRLIVVSNDTMLNRSALFECSTNMATNGLCASSEVDSRNAKKEVFYLNRDKLRDEGVISYQNDSFAPGASSMYVRVKPDRASNVAPALLHPYEYDVIDFDKYNQMNFMFVSLNSLGILSTYNWLICTRPVYGSAGLVFRSLAWMFGAGPPNDPDCVEVDIFRQWL